MWDFRHLIRRGGGNWPRTWRSENRPVRPPQVEKKTDPEPPTEAGGQSKDEHWLPPLWQPPADAADAWKTPEA